MWARVVEFMLACWLLVSPFIFGHEADETFLWANDFACAGLVSLFALVSFHHKLDKAHLLILPVAAWMIGVAFVLPEEVPPPAAYQNGIVVGFLLAMMAITPSRSHHPPRAWKAYYEDG